MIESEEKIEQKAEPVSAYHSKRCVAVYSQELAVKYGGPRYVIIEQETGKVRDDAQGYGYRSQQKAYAAWAYKTKPPAKKYAEAMVKGAVKRWLEQHLVVREELLELRLLAAKQEKTLTVKNVENMLRELEFDLNDMPFKAKDLLKYG